MSSATFLQPYGYHIKPLDQGEMEFRARSQEYQGVEAKYESFVKQRKEFEDSRPDVILTEHLVYIDKRPSNSNNFEQPRIDSRVVLNRQDILGGQRQQMGVEMAVDPRPIISQNVNADFNREQIKITRRIV